MTAIILLHVLTEIIEISLHQNDTQALNSLSAYVFLWGFTEYDLFVVF